jgi:hypothetical protein
MDEHHYWTPEGKKQTFPTCVCESVCTCMCERARLSFRSAQWFKHQIPGLSIEGVWVGRLILNILLHSTLTHTVATSPHTTLLWHHPILHCRDITPYYAVVTLPHTTLVWHYPILHCRDITPYYTVATSPHTTLLWHYPILHCCDITPYYTVASSPHTTLLWHHPVLHSWQCQGETDLSLTEIIPHRRQFSLATNVNMPPLLMHGGETGH